MATDASILERGDCYFFYQPKREQESAGSLKDVQRFNAILAPQGDKRYRLLRMGRKRMPEEKGRQGSRGERNWGFVSDVTKDSEDLLEALGPETYETKTRGEQEQAAARPVGEGVYAIVRHGDHTHLVTQLELPGESGKAQRDLNLKPSGNYIIAVKNPEDGGSPWAGLDEKRDAEFPQKLQKLFKERNFIPMDPPDFLNHEGCEFTVIGVDKDARDELGIDLDPEDEDKRSAEIFHDLGLDESVHPTKPLFEGKWE